MLLKSQWCEKYGDYLEHIEKDGMGMFKFINTEKCPDEIKKYLREWDYENFIFQGIHQITNYEELSEPAAKSRPFVQMVRPTV